MRKSYVSGLALAAVLAVVSPVHAQQWVEMRAARQRSGEKSLTVDVEFAAGELAVYPAGAGDLYDMSLDYDASRLTPTREWKREDGSGILRIGIKTLKDSSDHWEADEPPATLKLGVAPDVPTDLEVKVGAAKSTLDLGGLSLTSFTLRTGASDSKLDFDRPNQVRMKRLDISVGAASFTADNLGNARFDALNLEGAVGAVTLDFSGDWEGVATGHVKLGLGSLTLRVPDDVGVRIRKNTLLTSFSASGFHKTNVGYESDNWSTAAHKLDLEVEAAFGSVDIERAP